jgi:hypothetical protein
VFLRPASRQSVLSPIPTRLPLRQTIDARPALESLKSDGQQSNTRYVSVLQEGTELQTHGQPLGQKPAYLAPNSLHKVQNGIWQGFEEEVS